MASRMKGLNQFISDIRNCPNKESENRRVEKEMAKIRSKFTSQKGMDGYQRKKYVWKLLYILILGYDVDFGHTEAANLINSPKFSEKYTGYVATSMMVNESNELFRLVSNSIKSDLLGTNEIHQSLALSMCGTMAPKELVDSMYNEVQKMALYETSRVSMFVRKKSILTLLRIYRKFKEKFNVNESWSSSIFQMLDQRNLGFLSAVTSLLYGVVSVTNPNLFEECLPKAIRVLQKLVLQRDCTQDYLYYGTPNPWLQVKCLKILQLFNPPEDDNLVGIVHDILAKIVTKTEVTKSVNKNNADHGILFEAVNVIIHYRFVIQNDLRNQAISLLGVFISVKEPNIRYLALESISKFSQTPNSENLIQEHLKTILSSLRDNDVSIRRRALDILYVMCTQQTSSKVVDELLSYSDEPDQAIKEELVLKIAILAEKFADNLVWYIDVVVRLVTSSGDYITDDIWFRIIQIITGFGKEPDPELQKYAANKMLSALSVPNVHENLVKIGSYILAEYGELISHQPGKDPVRIFDTLNRHFTVSSAQTKAMLMNSYVKLAHRFPDLRDFVVPIFEIHSEHWDPDIQQRALEYLKLLQEDSTIEGVRPVILGKMPVYSEAIQTNNPLLTRIYALKLGPKSKDPTVMHEAKKLAEEEMFKSRSHTTNTQIFSTLQTLSKKETDYNTSNSSAKSYQTSAPVMNNLLDGYDEPAPSSDIKSHPLFNIAKNKLAVNVSNIVPLPGKLQFSNFNEMKALMTAKDGILYQDNNVEIQYKSQFDGPVGKIALQFATKGSSITQLNFNVQNTSNLFFQVSPVKYAEHPQIMMQVMNTGISSEVPKANMKFYQGEAFRNVDFEVPVTVNKFINPVDMPADKFLQFYNDYTTANNDKYFRLDAFIKNPAPPQVPVSEVMKKVGALLTNGLNFKAKFVDEDTKTEICGTANYTYKSESSANNVNLPIMVNVEAYTENKEFLRLSFRSAVASDVLKGLYQIVVFYLNP